MSKAIQFDQISTFQQHFDEDAHNRVNQRAVMKNGILASSENQSAKIANTPVFSVDLKTGAVTNQKKSGRCWMFAALNTLRHDMQERLNLKEFELSQNHTFFWDKFEKANYFYENILKTVDKPLTCRKVAFLLQTPQQDGGQWDMVVSVIQKYGVVPKSVMPETHASSNSQELNNYLNKKLRKDAIRLRQLVAEGADDEQIQTEKNQMLEAVYHLLVIALGTPPAQFDFSWRDADGTYHFEEALTPVAFYDTFVGKKLDDYVSIINAPTEDKPFNHVYTVDMLGNVVDGKEVRHLNLPIETFKELAVSQLQSGESVWFGCDVGQSSTRDTGIMALDAFSPDETLGTDFAMTKAERLDYGESMMTHAMVLTGVDLVHDAPVKWQVENSWGDKVGNKGFFVMSDDWMSEYTYQVVIHKKFLADDLLKVLEEDDVIVLKPWDPMGALA